MRGSTPSSRVHGFLMEVSFFTDYDEASQYKVADKGSYGLVAAAVDTHIGDHIAIKRINDLFKHISDATRILCEIKLLMYCNATFSAYD
jgi:hypothetical protein